MVLDIEYQREIVSKANIGKFGNNTGRTSLESTLNTTVVSALETPSLTGRFQGISNSGVTKTINNAATTGVMYRLKARLRSSSTPTEAITTR